MSARRYPWWVGPLAFAAACLLRVLGATWRVQRGGDDPWEPGRAPRQPYIFAFWHSGLLPLIHTHRGRGVAVLIGSHLDGEIVARAIGHLGFVAARGSSTRGGERGALEVLAFADAGRALAITPDGPRGPAEVLKPGVVYLASRSGLPVVPVASASSASWRVRSWDRLRVPKPFARVCVDFGAPRFVPADAGEPELERHRVEIESALRECTARARAAAGEAP